MTAQTYLEGEGKHFQNGEGMRAGSPSIVATSVTSLTPAPFLSSASAAWAHIRLALPEGRELPEHVWRRRHRFMLALVLFHAVGLAVFGLVAGWGPAMSLGEGGLVLALGAVAWWGKLGRRFRSSIAALAMVTSSAVLVQFSGGYIEMHFHFFVVVALVAMYQDWIPFGLAIAYVAVDHGLVGSLAPEWVYNHASGIAHPWRWATLHAGFILAECAALVAWWKSSEVVRAASDQVLRSAGQGILGLDETGRISFANPAAAAMAGVPQDRLIGRMAEDLILGLKLPFELEPAPPGQVGGGDGRRFGEGVVRRSSGEALPVEWMATPIEQADQIVGAVLTLTDLRERKEAERELEASRKQLAVSEKLSSLGTLVSGVGHEVRTPLTYIRTNLALLQAAVADAASGDPKFSSVKRDADRWVGAANEGIARIDRLVQELRRFAKPELVSPSPAGLHEVVGAAVDLFRSTQRGRVEIEARLEPTPPFQVDKGQVQQVVLNLMNNAADAMKGTGTVLVRTRMRGGSGEIEVEDAGSGIPPEVEARLFDPFFTTKRDGTGLGLTISRRIVEAHGGRLTYTTKVGHGTTFTIWLPPRARPPAAALSSMAEVAA